MFVVININASIFSQIFNLHYPECSHSSHLICKVLFQCYLQNIFDFDTEADRQESIATLVYLHINNKIGGSGLTQTFMVIVIAY